MPPEYRRPPNADTVYIYKDGPLMPDPELSGEEQLAQQAAYIASFANFDDDDDDLQIEEGENGEDDFGSDDDMFDENGEMRGMTDGEIEPYEPPAPEQPNEIMATLLREEKRGVMWLAISDDLDEILSVHYNSHFIAASRLDVGDQLRETQEIDPNNHKDSVPSLTEFDFPRYWNWTMGILAKEDSNPNPGLYPLQGDWKIMYRDPTVGYHADAYYVGGTTNNTTIDLPCMFKLHNEDLQAILVKWDVLPKEGLGFDEDGIRLVLEPTAEDAQNLAEILLMDSMTGGWVATSSLLSRIQEAYMTCGPPPKRESPVPGQPDLLVVEDDLNALVRLYHYYQDQAEPKLQAMRFVSHRMPGKNEKKEIADLVDRVIRMRNEVRAAKNTAVGIELKPKKGTAKKDKTAKKRKLVPRNHPISPWFQDPFGDKRGSETMPFIHWLNQGTAGQPKITDWTSPDAEDRYTTASVERAQGQLSSSKSAGTRPEIPWKNQTTIGQPSTTSPAKAGAEGENGRYTIESYQRAQGHLRNLDYTPEGNPKRQDGLEEWCQSVKSAEVEDPEQFLGIQVNDLEM